MSEQTNFITAEENPESGVSLIAHAESGEASGAASVVEADSGEGGYIKEILGDEELREETKDPRDNYDHLADHTFHNNVTIAGTLRTKRFVHPHGALFITKDKLLEELPDPRPGWWALTGAEWPAQLWVCEQPGLWQPADGAPWISGDDLEARLRIALGPYALKTDLGGYATEKWVLGKGYVTKLELDDYWESYAGSGGDCGCDADRILSIENAIAAVREKLDDMFELQTSGGRVRIKALHGLYTDEYLSARGDNPFQNQGSVGLDETQLAQYLVKNNYAKKSDIPSLAGYLKSVDAASTFLMKTDASDIYLTQIDAAVTYLTQTDFSSFKTGYDSWKADIDAFVSKFDSMFVKEPDGNGGFRIKALHGLYTDEYLSARGDNPFQNQGSVGLDETQLAQYLVKNNYAKKSDFPSLAPYAKTADIQQWVEDKGYLTDVAWGDVTGKPTWIGTAKPSYDFSEIGKKPNTIAGYGITDAKIADGVITLGTNTITPLVSADIKTLTFQSGSFTAKTYTPNSSAQTVNIPTTTSHITEGARLYFTDARAQAALAATVTAINNAIALKLDKSVYDTFKSGYDSWKATVDAFMTMFTLEGTGAGRKIKANFGLYTDSFLSARGANPNGSAGGGLIKNVYGWGSLGGTFSDSTLTDTFNAYTINKLATDKADKSWVTANYQPKGSYLTAHQSLDYVNIKDVRNTTPKPNAMSSKKITAWFNNLDKPSTLQNWYGGVTVQGWNSNENFSAWQLGANADNSMTDKNLYFRLGRGETWESWQTIVTSSNISSYAITSHQSLANYVTLDTEQTITGYKRFWGGLGIRFTADTSNAVGINWYATDNSTVKQSILAHNTVNRIILNPNGSADTWNDIVGKYSLRVGVNELTYNTKAILREDNYTSYVTTLRDRTNGTATYLNYGAAGISNPNWLAAWNGYELRAISPANVLACIGALPLSGGTMSNTNVVTNLNADLLDGVHNGSVTAKCLYDPDYHDMSHRRTSANINFANDAGIHTFLATSSMTTGKPSYDAHIIHAEWDNSLSWASQLSLPTTVGANIEFRQQDGTAWGAWKKLAFTSDNVASASRLATTSTYTAWGQTFFANGVPASVSGTLSSVGGINFSNAGAFNLDGYGNFKATTTAGNSWNVQKSDGTSMLKLMCDASLGFVAVTNFGVGTSSLAYRLDVAGTTRTTTLRIGDCEITYDTANGMLKFSKGIYSDGAISARGANSSGGGGGNFGLMRSWPTSAPANTTTDALAANLGWDLHTRLQNVYSKTTIDSMLENYVDKTSAQTISGLKRFSSEIVSDMSNPSSWWVSTAVRGKFIATNGGNNSGWSPVLGFKTVSGKYEIGSLGDTAYINYYLDTRTSNSVDVQLTLPKKTGTLVVTSDITSALASYLPLTGGTLTGDLTVRKIQLYGGDEINTSEGRLNLGWRNTPGGINLCHNNAPLTYGSAMSTIWHAGNDGSGSGLDADLLDGYHETSFVRSFWTNKPGYDCDTINTRSIISFTYGNNAPFTGTFIDVNTNGYGFYIGTQYGTNNSLYYRSHGSSGDKGMADWQQLARVTDNVASATKLANKRTLLVHNFNGEGNVSGNIIGAAGGINLEMTNEINCYNGDLYLNHRGNGTGFSNGTTANIRMCLNGGRVMVGTTTSSYALNAASFICDSWVRTKGTAGWYSETYGGGWYMTDSSWVRTYNNKGIYAGTATIRTDGSIQVGDGGSKFIVNASGNVGIGVTSPACTLDVFGDTQIDGFLYIKPMGMISLDGLDIYRNGDDYNFGISGSGKSVYIKSDGGMSLEGKLVADGFIQSNIGLRIGEGGKFLYACRDYDKNNPKGYVGINNDSPEHNLDVVGDAYIDTSLEVGGYSNILSPNVYSWNTGHAAYNVAINNDSAQTPLLLAYRKSKGVNASGADRLFAVELLDTGAKVSLSFAGTSKYELTNAGVLWTQGGVWSSGYISARGQNTSSDARLKKNLTPFEIELSNIAEAPSVGFNWLDGSRDVGSIAQYWRDVNPMLTPEGPDGYLTLQYGKTALLASITIAKKVRSHEERIAKLERENEELKRKIEILERR